MESSVAMDMAQNLAWTCRDRNAVLGPGRLVMGILNVTPNSFSDGGQYMDADRAVEHALQLEAEGAHIIDIGGESTRPGSLPVAAEEELRRVLPVIEALSGKVSSLLSIDTTKASVASRALEAGVHIVNDVSACTRDKNMVAVVRDHGAGVILMHMQGEPQTMQESPAYDDVVTDVRAYLQQRVDTLCEQGVSRDCIAIDPGIGFGKTRDHNISLLRELSALRSISRPIVVGVSRKSLLAPIAGVDPAQRVAASVAAMLLAAQRGGHILRVHDVKESCDALRVLDMLNREEEA